MGCYFAYTFPTIKPTGVMKSDNSPLDLIKIMALVELRLLVKVLHASTIIALSQYPTSWFCDKDFE